MPESLHGIRAFPNQYHTSLFVSDTPPNHLEGLLSEFSLGPAWARAKSEPVEMKFKHAAEREYQPRKGGDRRNDNRGGGGNRSGGSGGNRDDRRGRQGDGRRDYGKEGRGRTDFQREEIAPAEGVTVTLIPEKNAIQLIIKEVHQVARVYPLFDVAEIILAERSRLRATFEVSEKKPPLFRCKLEEAIYLTKEEAIRHLLDAPWRERFIEESTFEIDPPKGNFQSVAKCGISGEWLGPPNFHTYQTEIRRLHRERFSNMPFESYLAKVRTERSEEAVNAWLDSMKIQTRWRILSDEESAAVTTDSARNAGVSSLPAEPTKQLAPAEPSAEETPTPEEIAEQTSEEPEANADAAFESVRSEETRSVEPTAEATPEGTAIEGQPESPSPTEEIEWFTDRSEFERALVAKVLDKAFQTTRKAKVSAAIPGKSLSPGLLARLKGTGNHHRKHPAILIPLVCKILEAEHMPVFKRKGKLYTGPARPHALAADAVLAPRPAEMVKWIRENPPAKLEGLWKAVLPDGATAPPAEYAADLFWLLQQGHILLYTDDTLVVQEQPKPQEPKKPKAPKAPKPKVQSAAEEVPGEADDPLKDAGEIISEAVSGVAKLLTGGPAGNSEEGNQPMKDPSELISATLTGVAGIISDAAGQLVETALKATQSLPEDSDMDGANPAPEPGSTDTTHPEPSSHNSPAQPEASAPLPPKDPEPPETSPDGGEMKGQSGDATEEKPQP